MVAVDSDSLGGGMAFDVVETDRATEDVEWELGKYLRPRNERLRPLDGTKDEEEETLWTGTNSRGD